MFYAKHNASVGNKRVAGNYPHGLTLSYLFFEKLKEFSETAYAV